MSTELDNRGGAKAPFRPKKVTLVGAHVRLEPLALTHAEGLFVAGRNEDIWRYMPCEPVATPEAMRRWVQQALEEAATRKRIPFAIFLRSEEELAGSTSFFDIRTHDRALEIGWTWLGKTFQRTPVNTECKYLLLKHAFEELKTIRVQLKTDSRNEQSQRALQRIGAVREGVLRRHMVVAGGYVRDTVMYSIVDDDWPDVKTHLEELLRREPSSPA